LFLTSADNLQDVGKFREARLSFFSEIVSGQLFAEEASRRSLFPIIVPRVIRHLAQVNNFLGAKSYGGGGSDSVSMKYFDASSASASVPNSSVSGVGGGSVPVGSASASEKQEQERVAMGKEGLKCVEILGACSDIVHVRMSIGERREFVRCITAALPILIEFSPLCEGNSRGTRPGGAVRHSDMDEEGEGGEGREKRGKTDLRAATGEERTNLLSVFTVVLNIIHVMLPEDWDPFLEQVTSEPERQMRVARSIFWYISDSHTLCLFPKNWGTLIGFCYSTLLKFAVLIKESKIFASWMADFTSRPIQTEGMPEFGIFALECSVFSAFFDMCILFLSSSSLEAENFSITNQERYSDMRINMCTVVYRTWHTLAGYFSQFPEFINGIVPLAAHDMNVVSSRLVDCLVVAANVDLMMTKGIETFSEMVFKALDDAHLPRSLEENFFAKTEAKFQANPNLKPFLPRLEDQKRHIILLHNYHDIPSTEEERVETRICALQELLMFFRETKRMEQYRTYLCELCHILHLHKDSGELGMALQLLADMYSWDDETQVLPLKNTAVAMGKEPAWVRKERLSRAAATNMQEGKLFENAYRLLAEVAGVEKNVEYDYKAAAECLKQQAEIARAMAQDRTDVHHYYRVGFFGSDIPSNIRNKEFIYRGRSFEQLGDFRERLEKVYPDATFLTKTSYPDETVTGTPGMKILVVTMKESSEKELDRALEAEKDRKMREERQKAKAEGRSVPPVPEKKKPEEEEKEEDKDEFTLPEDVVIEIPELNVFSYSKPYYPIERKKGENEFIGQWLNQLFVRVEQAFPNCWVRSLVTEHKESDLNPLENAIRSIVEKNASLTALISQHEAHPEINLQPLAQDLQGVIMAAVNGGTTLYADAFLSDEYTRNNPSAAEDQQRLRDSIREQLQIASRGMKLFEQLCQLESNKMMAGLYDVLSEELAKTMQHWK